MSIATSASVPIPSLRRPAWYSHLHVQVLLAITAGMAVGLIWPDTGTALQPLGDAFIKLVKMIISPVIFLSVATGIAGMRATADVGRVAGKAFAYFFAVSTLALILGLVIANLVQPGAQLHIDPASLDADQVQSYAGKAAESSAVAFMLDMIPATAVSALTDGSILQTLLVAVLAGMALVQVGPQARPIIRSLAQLNLVVFRIVAILMRLAPIGAFGAMAFTTGKYGVHALLSLGTLVLTFYATSALFVLIILGAIARLNGFSILALIRYLRSELLLVLGTSSSEAALPSLIEKMMAAGCSRPVAGLVVSTGYSFNLDGTNIYMTLAALFIAQATGVDLSLTEQLGLLAVAMISSKGAAGVTGAGFITLAATLSIVPTVPIAGMALILGIDRFMSECRAITNFMGNAVATIVVARWEGAIDETRLRAALGGTVAGGQPAPLIDTSAD